MLLADELEIRYKKSSTTSMATTLSPLSVRIEILGFALLFHSYIIIHPCKDKTKLFFKLKSFSSYLEGCSFNMLTCTIEPISIGYN